MTDEQNKQVVLESFRVLETGDSAPSGSNRRAGLHQ